MKTEIIKLVVSVKIDYSNTIERKECIRRAKQCVTSTSILSANRITPIKVQLIQ